MLEIPLAVSRAVLLLTARVDALEKMLAVLLDASFNASRLDDVDAMSDDGHEGRIISKPEIRYPQGISNPEIGRNGNEKRPPIHLPFSKGTDPFLRFGAGEELHQLARFEGARARQFIGAGDGCHDRPLQRWMTLDHHVESRMLELAAFEGMREISV
jgi:hypothetical protein